MPSRRSESLSERDKQLLELVAKGLTQREIGERFGVTQSRIYQILRQIDERGFGEVRFAREEADRKRGRLRDY